MSVSVYYSFTSNIDLMANGELGKVEQEWDAAFEQEPYENWYWYDPEMEDDRHTYQGSTSLPLSDPDETHQALIIAIDLLSRLRNRIEASDWEVNLDDYEIPWDEDKKIYFIE
jgi:hypothetical protein